MSNQITIIFSDRVSQVSLQITNNFADTYDLRDNLFDTTRFTLAANQTFTFSTPGVGISSLTVLDYSAFTGGTQHNFAIDNLSFVNPSAVPEPSSLTLLGVAGTSCLGVVLCRRRASVAARSRSRTKT